MQNRDEDDPLLDAMECALLAALLLLVLLSLGCNLSIRLRTLPAPQAGPLAGSSAR